jgi:hypothetical protein
MHLSWGCFTGLSFDQEIPITPRSPRTDTDGFRNRSCSSTSYVRRSRAGAVEAPVGGRQLRGGECGQSKPHSARAFVEAAEVHHSVREYLVELEQQNPVEEPVHEQDLVSITDPDST